MSALTAPRNTPEYGDKAVVDLLGVPVEASVHLWPGSLIAVDQNGYAIPATPGLTNYPVAILGRSEIDADNTGNGTSVFSGNGTAGAIRSQAKRGTFVWYNGTGADAVAVTNIGQVVYAIDDQTVGLTPGLAGNRVPVGRLVAGPLGLCLDTTGVWVETNGQNVPAAANGGSGQTVPVPAAAALAVGTIVALNSSGQAAAATAGQEALGVLVNAPGATGALAIVQISGFCPVIKAAGTIAVGGLFESNGSGLAVAITATSVAGSAVTAGAIMGVATTAGVASATFAGVIQPRGIPATTPA